MEEKAYKLFCEIRKSLYNRIELDHYKEDNNYYIKSKDDKENEIVLECSNNDTLIVWKSDMKDISSVYLFSLIDDIFSEYNIIYPYIDKSYKIPVLEALGYYPTDFDNMIDELKVFPSYKKYKILEF